MNLMVVDAILKRDKCVEGGRGGGSGFSRFYVLWRVIHAHDFNIKPLLFLERAVNKSGDILFGMGPDSESLSHVHM